MTAIAYRDGVMAADSATVGNETKRGFCQKIARSPAGTLGAASGMSGAADEFRRWIKSGRIDEWIANEFPQPLPLAQERGMFGAIIATRRGRVICVDWQGRSVEMQAPFYVEGSAEPILLGAMAAGASAEEAIKIAIAYDTYCGGDVQVEYLDERPSLAGS